MIFSTGNKKAKYIVHFDYVIGRNGSRITDIVSRCAIKTLKTKKVVGRATSVLFSDTVAGTPLGTVNTVSKAKRRTATFTEALRRAKFDRSTRVKLFNQYSAVCRVK